MLERAPSERYRASPPGSIAGREGPGHESRAPGGLGRAFGLGVGAAAIGALVHVAFAVPLEATGGLLVVAATLGFVVGTFVRYGARSKVRARTRRGLGVGLAVAAVAAALAVNWGLSGRYLGPADFLDQVYGLLVPLQVATAAAGALAGTR